MKHEYENVRALVDHESTHKLGIEMIDAHVDRAIALLEPIASQYKPKQEPHTIYIDNPGEGYPHCLDGFYCEDCVDTSTKKAQMEENSNAASEGREPVIVCAEGEVHGWETDDYELCQSCGERFDLFMAEPAAEFDHFFEQGVNFTNEEFAAYEAFAVREVLAARYCGESPEWYWYKLADMVIEIMENLWNTKAG